MAKPQTVRAAEARRDSLLAKKTLDQKNLVGNIERLTSLALDVSPSRLFAVTGVRPHQEARQFVSLLFRRHPELNFSSVWVASYLYTTETQIGLNVEAAARVLAQGEATAFGRDMFFVCEQIKLDHTKLLTVQL